MKYNATFTLNHDASLKQANAVITISNSGAFAYGNGKAMSLSYDVDGSKNTLYYDIRYDVDYSEANELNYVTNFIKNIWSGNNGSWKATNLVVEEA